MDEKLEKLHAHINDILRFAEGKNGALLALNGLVIVEALKNVFDSKTSTILTAIFLYLLVCHGISFICVLVSFLPNQQSDIDNEDPVPNDPVIDEADNLLFFDVIRDYTVDAYFEGFGKKYDLAPTSKIYCLDLIRQIIVQSSILSRKLRWFNVAAMITLCSFSPLGLLAYFGLRKRL
jgi:ABC-type transport system involved in multi-copper enzyme maturation permease subunit